MIYKLKHCIRSNIYNTNNKMMSVSRFIYTCLSVMVLVASRRVNAQELSDYPSLSPSDVPSLTPAASVSPNTVPAPVIGGPSVDSPVAEPTDREISAASSCSVASMGVITGLAFAAMNL